LLERSPLAAVGLTSCLESGSQRGGAVGLGTGWQSLSACPFVDGRL